MNDDIDAMEKACGACAHCDQSGNGGLRRYCSVKKEMVDALGKPCGRYEDLWEPDLFGQFFRFEQLKKKNKIT